MDAALVRIPNLTSHIFICNRAYPCYWEMINPNAVSGWGVDALWCQYLSEVRANNDDRAHTPIESSPLIPNATHSLGSIHRCAASPLIGRAQWWTSTTSTTSTRFRRRACNTAAGATTMYVVCACLLRS